MKQSKKKKSPATRIRNKFRELKDEKKKGYIYGEYSRPCVMQEVV